MRIARSTSPTRSTGKRHQIARAGDVADTGGKRQGLDAQQARATGRALVPAQSTTDTHTPSQVLPPRQGGSGRAGAQFLTQLIATGLNLEVTRARRRAAPAVALAAYAASDQRPAAYTPATFRRSL